MWKERSRIKSGFCAQNAPLNRIESNHIRTARKSDGGWLSINEKNEGVYSIRWIVCSFTRSFVRSLITDSVARSRIQCARVKHWLIFYLSARRVRERKRENAGRSEGEKEKRGKQERTDNENVPPLLPNQVACRSSLMTRGEEEGAMRGKLMMLCVFTRRRCQTNRMIAGKGKKNCVRARARKRTQDVKNMLINARPLRVR